MNFNTQLSLWNTPACREAYPTVRILDGHVIAGNEVIARFSNDEAAKDVLTEAGWNFKGENGFAAQPLKLSGNLAWENRNESES